MVDNAAEDVCQPSLRIDGVELGGLDQGIGDSCRLTATLGPHEEIIFSAESHTAHGSLRRIVVRLQANRAGQIGAPWEFLQQCTLREDEVLGIEAVGADWTIAFEGAVNLVPQIVAGERYMAPRQWCDLGEQRTGDGGALVVDEADGATKIDGVP